MDESHIGTIAAGIVLGMLALAAFMVIGAGWGVRNVTTAALIERPILFQPK